MVNMNFKDITKWSVKNTIATPAEYNMGAEDMPFDYQEFNNKNKYITDAPDGIFDAKLFKRVVTFLYYNPFHPQPVEEKESEKQLPALISLTDMDIRDMFTCEYSNMDKFISRIKDKSLSCSGLEFLISKGYDVFGLIDKGLAININKS